MKMLKETKNVNEIGYKTGQERGLKSSLNV